eukprot:163272-Chlamydomonas_euryale.AAC.1
MKPPRCEIRPGVEPALVWNKARRKVPGLAEGSRASGRLQQLAEGCSKLGVHSPWGTSGQEVVLWCETCAWQRLFCGVKLRGCAVAASWPPGWRFPWDVPYQLRSGESAPRPGIRGRRGAHL